MSTVYGLSPTSLGLFKDCPRCFWLEKHDKVKRPEGIKASLPNGMDRVMKAHVDYLVYRNKPIPWLMQGIAGNPTPFKDRERLKKFKSWTTFQRSAPHRGIVVKAWAGVDDLIEHEDGSVSPWDFKTKGSEPGDGYGEKYYQTQLDMIHFLLEGQPDLKCSGLGVLSYGWPVSIDENANLVFGWKNLLLKTDPVRAMDLMVEATKCLEGQIPPQGEGCEFCAYVGLRAVPA